MTVAEALSVRDTVNQAVYEHQAASVWRGVPMDKCAQDVLAYQEIVWATRPDVIIETGTWYGGSALFLADLCEIVGHGEVLTVDRNALARPRLSRRLEFLDGDSIDPMTVSRVAAWARGRRGMVVLDSDHTRDHVLAELDAYAEFVAVGGFLVVEDTNLNGHPVRPDFGPGPHEAVIDWLARTPSFQAAPDEPYITFNPGGFLVRTR